MTVDLNTLEAATVIQILGTAGTLAAAVAALLTARETQRQSRNSVRPFPVLTGQTFERSMAAVNPSGVLLALENVGLGPLLNVVVTWDFSNLLKRVRDRSEMLTDSGFLKFERGGKKIIFNLGDVINFRSSFIRQGANNSINIPHVVMSIVDEVIESYVLNDRSSYFPEIYFFAKVKYNDVFDNLFIEYVKIELSLSFYKKGDPDASYAAQWKVLKSNHLEF